MRGRGGLELNVMVPTRGCRSGRGEGEGVDAHEVTGQPGPVMRAAEKQMRPGQRRWFLTVLASAQALSSSGRPPFPHRAPLLDLDSAVCNSAAPHVPSCTCPPTSAPALLPPQDQRRNHSLEMLAMSAQAALHVPPSLHLSVPVVTLPNDGFTVATVDVTNPTPNPAFIWVAADGAGGAGTPQRHLPEWLEVTPLRAMLPPGPHGAAVTLTIRANPTAPATPPGHAAVVLRVNVGYGFAPEPLLWSRSATLGVLLERL